MKILLLCEDVYLLFFETHKSYTHTVNRHALDDDIHVYIENQTMDPLQIYRYLPLLYYYAPPGQAYCP